MHTEHPEALCQDQAVSRAVFDVYDPLWQDRKLLRRIPRRPVAHPLLAISIGVYLLEGSDRQRKYPVARGKFLVDVLVPIEHVDEVVEILMMFGRNILGHQTPIDDAALDDGLKHREDVTVDLRLVGDQRTRRVQDSRIDL